MLALTRKTDESIIIGDNIEVKVLEVRGDRVTLGIEAPSDISIHRQEIYLEIQEENTKASKASKNATINMKKLKDLLK